MLKAPPGKWRYKYLCRLPAAGLLTESLNYSVALLWLTWKFVGHFGFFAAYSDLSIPFSLNTVQTRNVCHFRNNALCFERNIELLSFVRTFSGVIWFVIIFLSVDKLLFCGISVSSQRFSHGTWLNLEWLQRHCNPCSSTFLFLFQSQQPLFPSRITLSLESPS